MLGHVEGDVGRGLEGEPIEGCRRAGAGDRGRLADDVVVVELRGASEVALFLEGNGRASAEERHERGGENHGCDRARHGSLPEGPWAPGSTADPSGASSDWLFLRRRSSEKAWRKRRIATESSALIPLPGWRRILATYVFQ